MRDIKINYHGDDSDPAGDAVILQSHKDMGFVPPNADGFSKEHWGSMHTKIWAICRQPCEIIYCDKDGAMATTWGRRGEAAA